MLVAASSYLGPGHPATLTSTVTPEWIMISRSSGTSTLVINLAVFLVITVTLDRPLMSGPLVSMGGTARQVAHKSRTHNTREELQFNLSQSSWTNASSGISNIYYIFIFVKMCITRCCEGFHLCSKIRVEVH
jgi:hypothetical protein